MKTVIGLTGKAKAGKDTFAGFLKAANAKGVFSKYGIAASETAAGKGDVEIYPLAKPFKDIGLKVFGFSYAQMYDPILKERVNERWGISGRQFMQTIGEGIRNTWRKDIWLQLAKDIVDHSKSDYIIIPDFRQDFEVEFFRALEDVNFKLIRISRKEDNNLIGDTKIHITEQGITLKPDIEVYNYNTLEELEIMAAKVLNEILHA